MKSACFLVFLLSVAYAHAQQGLLGGTLNYSSQHTTTEHATNVPYRSVSVHAVGLNPYYAHRLNEEWVVAVQAGIGLNRVEELGELSSEDIRYSILAYSAGLFSRRYFGTDKPLQFFLEAGGAYSINDFSYMTRARFINFGETTKTLNIYIAPGLSWAISQRFNLIARFGKLEYLNSKLNYTFVPTDNRSKFIGLNLNTETIRLGAELKL